MNKLLHLFLSLNILCTSNAISPSGPSLPLYKWLNLVLQAIGVNVLDGDSSTNGGPLISNNLSQPPIANAEYYVHFQAASYCYRLDTWTCPACLHLATRANISFIRVVENTVYNTFGYIALDHTNRSIILTFRGTTNVQNSVEDLDFVLVSPWSTDTSIKVHMGFYSAMMSLYDEIVSTVNAQLDRYPKYRLVVIGHSLGGAEAALFIFKLNIEKIYSDVKMEIYTYGEPRNGNKAYADAFNFLSIPCARVVERGDVVPHFFPAEFGFYHHQNELWIYDPGTNAARYCNTTLYEDPSCSNSQGPLYNAVDHLIYFGVDVSKCIQLQPWDFILQLLNPLGSFFPFWIKQLFPGSTGYYNPYLLNIQTILS